MSNKDLQTAPKQIALDLGVEIQRDVNGIEMGILENGIPFLTQRGLALATGAHRSAIQDISQEWVDHYDDDVISKDRISFIKEYLFSRGYTDRMLYIETTRDGSPHYAYPDIVCMAILEYYAFETRSPNKQATENYRSFAAFGLRKFIYESLNYTPGDKWQYHHERVSLLNNASPEGYYIVFNEVTGLIVDLITADLTVNHKTIPDISVGQSWAKHWQEFKYSSIYGERISCEHNYPARYPQSKSNPQEVNAYPNHSLAEFRRWFKHDYLRTKFPAYILKKANILAGGKDEALQIGGMYSPKLIK
ncbi:lambda phage CII family protein [Pseudomonas fluorescens]|uniref:lambda phage CII family protein n=1 Tax=Pseudomonas fluorescens TaxID=294 RepID=UPI00209A6545|nr:lambda phage CII family protein [Pseudomonas fluorescens]MCO7626437.1 lambda phage CII family protein [Pseudomonas fluorescens]